MFPMVLFITDHQKVRFFPCSAPQIPPGGLPGAHVLGPRPEWPISANPCIPRVTLMLPPFPWLCRYARLQEWDDFQIFFNKTKNLVPRRTPTALYHQGICRYMEAQVLHLQKQIEEQSENAQDSGVELLKVRLPSGSCGPSLLGWVPVYPVVLPHGASYRKAIS